MNDPQDFVAFWNAYPRHVGRLAAAKAYRRALQMATPEQILAGVAAYVAHKPAYADWCHPTTWLNQGRWLDEYDAPARTQAPVDWWEECKAIHNGECGGDRWKHHIRKDLERAKAEA